MLYNDFNFMDAFVGFGLFFFLVSFVMYFLRSYGMYKMAVNEGNDLPFLAFFPIGDMYVWGNLIEHRLGSSGGAKLIGIYLGAMFLSLIPILGLLILLSYIVFSMMCLHFLYEKYSDSAGILTVMSILSFGFAIPIIIFALRDKESSV